MGLSEIMAKSNPARCEREMKNSEYLKLVDRNTELVDELKEYKSRTEKAIEYLESYLPSYDFDHTNIKRTIEMLRGEKE